MRRNRKQDETTVLTGNGVSQDPALTVQLGLDARFQGAEDIGSAVGSGLVRGRGQGHSAAGPGFQAGVADTAPESIVVRVRRHGRRLTIPVVLLIATAAAAGYFVGALPEAWMNLLAGAGAVLVAGFAGIGPILGWLSHRAIVTTRRVIVRHGVFVRHRSEISLGRVREVRSRQNPVQRLWGSGDIDLIVGTESTRLTDVPQVKELHAALQELSERSYDAQLRASAFGY